MISIIRMMCTKVSLLVIVSLTCASCVTDASDATTLRFMKDAVTSPTIRGSSSRVNAYVCWGKARNARLWHILSANNMYATICSDWQQWSNMNIIDTVESVLFILDIDCPNAKNLLTIMGKRKLFGFPHRWLIVDTSLKTDDGQDNVNITEPSKMGTDEFDIDKSNATINSFTLSTVVSDDRSSAENEISSRQRSAETLDEDINKFQDLYGTLEVFVDSQVVICQRKSHELFLLVEIYRRGQSGDLLTNVIGEWDSSIGLTVDRDSLKSVATRRYDLQGTTLKASMVVTNNDTLKHLTDLKNRHIDTITKSNYALLQNALEMINASLELLVVDSWGYATNGSWSGMVGHLQRGEADIGATALFFTKERLNVLEYIAMTTPTRAAFVFRKPPLSYVSNVFTLPFSDSVWISSAVLVTLTAALLYAALVWEARRRNKTLLDQELEEYLGPTPDTRTATWSDVTLLSLGAVCQQGSTVEPRGVPGRLVTLTLFIVVMFLYTSYSASIVSLLQSSTESINTLDDLLHSRLDVGVHDIVYNHHYFKTSTDPVRKAIYEKKVAPAGKAPRFMTLDEGVRRIRKGLFAFHMEQSPGYQLISETFREEEKCGFKEIHYLQVIDPYLAIQQKSPYREMLKLGYRRIFERGLQSRTLQQYYTKKPECTSHGSNFVSVGIVDFYPALLVLAYGFACSIGVLVIEVLVHKRQWMNYGVKH